MRKRPGLLIFTLILLSARIQAQENPNAILDHGTEVLIWLDEHNVPAVGIGIIKDGKLSQCKVYGKLQNNIPARDDAIFSIASVTKTIVAVMTLKLVEKGQWDLDEPLYKYWVDPDVADDERHKKLTTRHVLSHQSGLPNWRSELDSKKLEFLFEPGTKYQYSGEGFEYLKKALETKFEKPLEVLSDLILFTPLDMNSTNFYWQGEIDERRFAFKHNKEGKIYKEEKQTSANAASGLLTTVEDYSKFGIDVINGAGLSDSLFDEMISSQKNIKKNIDQGLGWQVIRNLPKEEYALMHEGGSNGVSTLVVLLPVSERGVVIFTNGDQGDKVYLKVLNAFIDVGKNIIEELNKMSYDPEKLRTVELSGEILSSYTGSYFVPSFQMSVNIIYEDNSLKIETPYTKMVLYAESETEFFLKDDDLRMEFVCDENKGVTGFMMSFKGAETEFSKKTIGQK